MERKPYRSHGNDLYFDMQCNCPSPLFTGSPVEHLMKHRVTLTGYDDANFFDNVNREPRELACGNCGRKIRVQWFEDGVEAEFIK